MGVYVNPVEVDKETWLADNGRILSGPPKSFDEAKGFLPVCLVDNGFFNAAAVCYSPGELAEFSDPRDHRQKSWWLCLVTDLMAVSDLKDFV